MMKSRSKTKKVFVDINSEKKQNIPNTKLNPNNMLRRFKSHEVYNTVRGTKLKNGQNSQKNSSNDNKILTINLNLQNSDENTQKQNSQKNEHGIRYSSNSKDKENFPKNKIKTEYTKSKSNQRFLTNKQIEKINLYINSGRRNQMDSIKILNEESIQELDTEDNYNYIENGNNEMIKTEGNSNINNNQINNINDNENLYKNYYSEPQKISNGNIENNLILNLQYLSSAKKNDKDSVLECLSKKGIMINYQNENGWSALHFACDEGNLKIVEILLKAQIDVNLLTNEKKTALHFAASRGYFDISKLLIEKKANLNLCDNEKNLPVHLCAMTQHNELLNYLLEQNPQSALIKNLYGKTPLDLAVNEENKIIIQKFIPLNNNMKGPKNNSNTNLNKHNNPSNNFMKEQCRRIKIHNTNTKQINSLMKTINQNGRKSIPKKAPMTAKYSKPKTAEKSNNQNNNNINTNKYNKKINGNVIMVSTSTNFSAGCNTNTPHYNTTQGNFNYNSTNNSKVKKQPERVKVILESPKKISSQPQNQLNKTRTKSRYNNNNNINNSNSNNIHTNKSNNKNLHKDNLNLNLAKNKKNNNANNNNINNLSNYNSTNANTKKTISIFSSKIATSRKTANAYPDKISSVNNSNNNNNIHSNLSNNTNNMHANINLNNKNKELGKHRTISVPRFSNYHLNISNNNNINYNNGNNINGNETGNTNKIEKQEKRRKSLSDSRKNKIVKKNNNQKLNNFNLIENIEISLEFDGNEKLNSLKKVSSNNNLKITNNFSDQTQSQNIINLNNNSSNQNSQSKQIKNQSTNITEIPNKENEILNKETPELNKENSPTSKEPNIPNNESSSLNKENPKNQNLNSPQIQNLQSQKHTSQSKPNQKPIISSIINLSEVKIPSPNKNTTSSNEEDLQTINNNTKTNNNELNTNSDQNTSNQIVSLLNTSKTELKEQSISNESQNESSEDENDSSNNNSLSSESTEEKIGPSSFICIALLGRGSFGEVYLVEHKKTNEKYAMKVLDKNRIAEQNIFKYAMTERNVLSIVHNPFIVKLNFAFQTNEKLFLLLDYCPGGDLAEQLQLQTRFSEEKAKFYLCEVILALGELHKKDIIFRDLKPDNVVIDKEGHAMLTDFGLSREGVYDAKIAKSFCGSIAYLAPEMLSRTGHGKAVDWYLLGVLFYEMLVGIPPYFTNSKEQIFKNIERADLKIPNFVSNKAQKLIKALLKKDPNLRLGSKGDVDEIMKFDYFKDVDWNKVYNRELKPPKNIQDGRQIKMFKEPKLFADDESDDEKDDNGNEDNTKFEGWSFVQGNSQKLESNSQYQIHSQSQMNNNRSYNRKK